MQTEREREKRYFKIIKYTKIMLTVLCIIAILFLIGRQELNKGQARHILKDAKLIRLVTQNTYYEYYAFDKPFFEATGTGLSTQHEKDILETAKCTGDIQQIRFNKDSFRVSHLIYVEDGYIVEFNDTGDNPQWIVYKLNKLID